jgi:hypothetical protein
VQLESTKEPLEVNGMAQNMEVPVQSDESQTTVSGQPIEETTANASAWPEWLMGKQPKVVVTSNQPPE